MQRLQQQQQGERSSANANRKKRKKKKKKKVALSTGNIENEEEDDEEDAAMNAEADMGVSGTAEKEGLAVVVERQETREIATSLANRSTSASNNNSTKNSRNKNERDSHAKPQLNQQLNKDDLDVTVAIQIDTNNIESPMSTPGATVGRASQNDAIAKHRQERFQRLVDQFLDARITADNNASADDDTKTKTNGTHIAAGNNPDFTLDISQLSAFIAETLRDVRDESPSSTTKPPVWQSGNRRTTPTQASPITLIPFQTIEIATRSIQCPTCRSSVERILLPKTQQQQRQSVVNNYRRRIWLKGIKVPTLHDTYKTDEEMEEQATQYQLLMEEGVAPSEQNENWSFELQMGLEEDKDRNQLNQKSPSLLGWQLHRPQSLQNGTMLIYDTALSNLAESKTTTPATGGAWSVTDLDFVLQHYVVFQGLHPDEITGADPTKNATKMSETMLASIATGVAARKQALEEDFHNIAKEFARSLEPPSPNSSRRQDMSDVEWTDFPRNQTNDEAGDFVLNELLKIIIDITRSVQNLLTYTGRGALKIPKEAGEDSSFTAVSDSARGVSLEDVVAESHWAVSQCQMIWRTFLDGLQRIMARIDAYQQQLLKLADRNGSFPIMFASKPSRELFHNLVMSKLMQAHSTIITINSQLNHPTSTASWNSEGSSNTVTSFVARLWTEEAFYKTVSEGNGHPSVGRQAVDSAWEDVLQTVRELTTVEQYGKVGKLVEKQQQHHGKLLRLLDVVAGNLNDMNKALADVPSSNVAESNVLKDMHQEVLSVIQNRPDLSPDDLRDAVDKIENLKEWRSSTMQGLVRVSDQWISYRLYHDVKGYKRVAPAILPHELRRSMIPGASILWDGFEMPCTGGDEENRASCLLVTLFCVRLAECFREWQACRAEQELLTTIDDNDYAADTATISAPIKASKKTKKKPPRKSAATLIGKQSEVLRNGDNINDNTSSNAVPATTTEVISVPETEAAVESFITNRSDMKVSQTIVISPFESGFLEQVKPIDTTLSVEEPVKDTSPREKSPPTEVKQDCDASVQQLDSMESKDTTGSKHCVVDELSRELAASLPRAGQVPPSALSVDARSGVGVYDRSGFQDAETFLVERLLALLEIEDNASNALVCIK